VSIRNNILMVVVQQSFAITKRAWIEEIVKRKEKYYPERYNCGVPGRIFTTRFHQAELSIQNLYTYAYLASRAEVIGMWELWGQTAWSPPHILCCTMWQALTRKCTLILLCAHRRWTDRFSSVESAKCPGK